MREVSQPRYVGAASKNVRSASHNHLWPHAKCWLCTLRFILFWIYHAVNSIGVTGWLSNLQAWAAPHPGTSSGSAGRAAAAEPL